MKKKTIKAWALLQLDGEVAIAFNHAHSVFQPRIYSTEIAAIKVSETVVTGTKALKITSCTITYTLPSNKKRV
ncbi:MAG: hypothetical protein Q6360_13175 [Candidatus Brocadiales bacterium]|nr:hypothetical protein [Candidatus Brocadiales bacterium]